MLHAATRRGKVSRRRLEFAVIRDQIDRRSAAFYTRIRNRLRLEPDGCITYQGTRGRTGYAQLTFRYRGRFITIHAHRLFLILQLGCPIPLGYDAGHTHDCKHRHCVAHVFQQPWQDNAATDPTGEHLPHG